MKQLVLASLLAPLLLAGCSGPQAARKPVVWPYPPEKPRVRFVRAFASEADLGQSGFQTFMRAVTGNNGVLAINQPMGLALRPGEQRLVVACPAQKIVLEFNLATKEVTRVAADEAYKPKSPFDVAVDADDNLYVSDSVGRAVMVYGPHGDFLRKIGSEKLLERPTGLAIDNERKLLYVADSSSRSSNHHTVETFTLDGKHVRSIGKKGDGLGEFYFPVYLAVSPNGNLYVADTFNNRIQVFSPKGKFLTTFGKQGEGFGAFGRIKGLAFDAFGNLHVVDGEYGIIQIFNADHVPLMYYGGRANLLEFFDMPTAIVADSKKNVYVANFYMARINQYELINITAEEVAATLKSNGAQAQDDTSGPAKIEQTPEAPTGEVQPASAPAGEPQGGEVEPASAPAEEPKAAPSDAEPQKQPPPSAEEGAAPTKSDEPAQKAPASDAP